MTTAIRPIGFGEFEPVHRPRNEDLTPPPSARLPPIQTQAANQWSKNIWEYNNKGGSGFGAVARPKDFEDRKSPSLLSPVGNGPSPWTRSALSQNSPVELPTNTLGVKWTTTPTDTSQSNDLISSKHQSASQLSRAHASTALSVQTRDIPASNFYRRPAEINSALPTYNRMDTFAREEDEDRTQPERKSLSSWNTPPTGRVNRQASYGMLARHMPNGISSAAQRTSRPEQIGDYVPEHTSWSSTRLPISRDQVQGQRSYSYTASGRQSHLHGDDDNELEGSFSALDMADEAQYAAVAEQWQPGGESRQAYTMQSYPSENLTFVPQDALRASSQSKWRPEAIPRSFGAVSTRQQAPQRDQRLAQAFQNSFQPGLRGAADLSQQRFQTSFDEYSGRPILNEIDTQSATGLVQYDGNAIMRASQHQEFLQLQQIYQQIDQMRAQGYLPSPYGYLPMPYGGMHNVTQPPMMANQQRLLAPVEPSSGIRSQLLEDYLNSMKSNGKRYELREIYNHGVEFSGNQHGSKFIQNKLETATSDEKDRIFGEILPNAIQLMKDIYGNYVIQKFFERGDQSQKTALFNVMSGKVYELSCQIYGCRVVQTALMHVLVHQQAAMVEELKSHVLDCVRDQNGNHVIQVVVKHVPVEYTEFVVNAFIGQIQHLATHPYGCRVVQRLLDHCIEPGKSQILKELHACASTLISDQYGNYVAQHVIEFGSSEDKAKMIGLVRQHLIPYSKQKFASNVVERCLKFGDDAQKRDIMLQMIAKETGGESALPLMIKDSFGNYVIQQLLDRLAPDDYAYFVEALGPEIANLRRMAPNNKQVDNVAKKMYKPEPFYHSAQFRQPAPSPIHVEVANSHPPALTFNESSPFSTSQPSLVDETQPARYAKGVTSSKPEIRIEVTDH